MEHDPNDKNYIERAKFKLKILETLTKEWGLNKILIKGIEKINKINHSHIISTGIIIFSLFDKFKGGFSKW